MYTLWPWRVACVNNVKAENDKVNINNIGRCIKPILSLLVVIWLMTSVLISVIINICIIIKMTISGGRGRCWCSVIPSVCCIMLIISVIRTLSSKFSVKPAIFSLSHGQSGRAIIFLKCALPDVTFDGGGRGAVMILKKRDIFELYLYTFS